MDRAQVSVFQGELGKKLTELKIETNTAEGLGGDQLGDTFRVLLPMLNSGGDAALMELAVGEMTEEAQLLMFHSTMIMEIGPGLPRLREATELWNLSCPLGAFQVWGEARQYYHRYSYPFHRDTPPEELAETAMYLIELLCTVISGRFTEAVKLSAGD